MKLREITAEILKRGHYTQTQAGKILDIPQWKISNFTLAGDESDYEKTWQDFIKLQRLWAHDLRATFVTEKERQGWPRKLIREFSGHRSEIIFNRYSRPTLDDLRAFIGDSRHEGQRGGNRQAKRPGLRLVSSGKIKEG